MRTAITLAVAIVASLVLVACTGGGSTAPMPPAEATEVPASATVSTAAYVDYTGKLAPSETREPLDVSKVVPPTSETDEPMPIS